MKDTKLNFRKKKLRKKKTKKTDRDFSAFPHRPYPIQTAFMQALYSALDEKRLALFESPTGTGKTLSLVVGTLTWLEDKRRAAAEAEEKEEEEEEEGDAAAAAATAGATATATDASNLKEAEALPPWLAEAAAERAREAKGAREERRQRRLRKARERRDAALAGVSRAEWAARARRRAAKEAAARAARAAAAGSTSAFSSSSEVVVNDGRDDDDEQFLINSDDGGDEGVGGAQLLPNASSTSSHPRRRRRALSPAVSSSSSDDNSSSDGSGGSGDEETRRIRVVVASRTHSQLSQFVGELRRTRFADSVAAVALGSRAQLCVNDKVLGTENGGKGFSASAVAERCRDLQKQKRSLKKPREGLERGGGGKEQQQQQQEKKGHESKDKKKGKAATTCGCPFRSNPDDPGARRAMRDALLSRPTDVEEAAAAGRALGACPYYASRAALPDADVVFVPYAGLLSADAREAVGLKLRGAVVVVDEAHNLPAAVASAYSARVSLAHLRVSSKSLRSYLERYGPRLNPSGRRDVQMLLAVSESLGRWLLEGGGGGGGGGGGAGGGGLSSASSSSAAAAAAAAAAASNNNSNNSNNSKQQQRALTVDAFVSSAGLDNINAFRLVQSLKEKHAVAKVAGAADAAAARERKAARAAAAAAEAAAGGTVRPSGRRKGAGKNKGTFSSSSSRFSSTSRGENLEGGGSSGNGSSDPTPTAALHALVSFAAALTTTDADGRVVVERGNSSSSSSDAATATALRFVLLNAGARFGAVLAEARAVVLASGTLEPSASLAAQLFPPQLPQPSVKPLATTTIKAAATTAACAPR